MKFIGILYISSILYGFGGVMSGLSIIIVIHRQREYYRKQIQSKSMQLTPEKQQTFQDNQRKDKAFLSIWSNHYNLALIISEPLFDWAIYTLKVGWQIPIIIWAVVNFSSIVYLYVRYHDHKAQQYIEKDEIKENEKLPEEGQRSNTHFNVHLSSVLREMLCNKKRISIVSIFFSLKILNNQMVTIFPLFLSKIGLQGNEGKLISIYFFSAILGSFLFNGLDWLIHQIYSSFYSPQQPTPQFPQRQQITPSSSNKPNLTIHFSNVLTSYLTLIIILTLLGYLHGNVVNQIQTNFFIFALYMSCLGLFIGGLVNYSRTSLILETINDPKYQKAIKDINQNFKTDFSSSSQNPNPNNKPFFGLIDFQNATIGLFTMILQITCIPVYMIAFKLIEICNTLCLSNLFLEPSLFLWEYSVLCLIAFLGELYRNYTTVKEHQRALIRHIKPTTD